MEFSLGLKPPAEQGVDVDKKYYVRISDIVNSKDGFIYIIISLLPWTLSI